MSKAIIWRSKFEEVRARLKFHRDGKVRIYILPTGELSVNKRGDGRHIFTMCRQDENQIKEHFATAPAPVTGKEK